MADLEAWNQHVLVMRKRWHTAGNAFIETHRVAYNAIVGYDDRETTKDLVMYLVRDARAEVKAHEDYEHACRLYRAMRG